MSSFTDVTIEDRQNYNKAVTHPLQSFEWGEFRAKNGIKVIRRMLRENGKILDAFTLTVHPIPHTPYNIGYLPKGALPTPQILEELKQVGKNNKCIFIQLEPHVRHENVTQDFLELVKNKHFNIVSSHHPLFTKYTFILDLTKNEEELLSNMHPKTRYNIRVAQKHGVLVKEDSTDSAFKTYLSLMNETTNRQGFFAHSNSYHKTQWESLPHAYSHDQLSSHLLTASYQEKVLVVWILFAFNNSLYYPYGASSALHREVMASNMMMWEAIRFGKKLGLSEFDMWGALEKTPNVKNAWYGFHRFKEGYGAKHVEFIGSFDFVINSSLYQIFRGADVLRWAMLSLKKKLFR